MTVTLDHWLEWKEICSVAGCGEEAKSAITSYLENISFELAGAVEFSDFDNELISPVGLFDSYLMGKTLERRYFHKDWMIERSFKGGLHHPEALNNLNKNAYCLLRTAIRDMNTKEGHGRMVAKSKNVPPESMDAPVVEDEDLSLHDLLPDAIPAEDPVFIRECEQIATLCAGEWLGEHDKIDRQILAAHHHRIPLSSEIVRRITGREKSGLSARSKAMINDINRFLRNKFPEEHEQAYFLLSRHLLVEVERRCGDEFEDELGPD